MRAERSLDGGAVFVRHTVLQRGERVLVRAQPRSRTSTGWLDGRAGLVSPPPERPAVLRLVGEPEILRGRHRRCREGAVQGVAGFTKYTGALAFLDRYDWGLMAFVMSLSMWEFIHWWPVSLRERCVRRPRDTHCVFTG